MGKKVLAIFIVICIGLSFIYYSEHYTIENNLESIQSNLKEWLNRKSWERYEPHLLKNVQLQDSSSYIAVFQLDGNYGYAHLIKGLNGKFKIVASGYSSIKINYREIKTNKGMYMVLYGINSDLKINHILAESEEPPFILEVNISNEHTFIKYEQIEYQNPLLLTFTYYDENNNEIDLVKLIN